MKACRSISPDGQGCTRPRGHKRQHRNPAAKKGWQDGVKRPASWVYMERPDHVSEGDYQSYGRYAS